MTIEFLSKPILETCGEISTRLGNVLRNEGFQTVFAALRVTEAELNRTPNLGRKGIEEFRQYVGGHGYRPGDTADFFATRRHELMYENGQHFSYAGGSPGMRPNLHEKEIVESGDVSSSQISKIDYHTAIREFAASHEQRKDLDVITQHDMDWISSLLPESARDGLSAAFEKSADLRASLGLLKQDAFRLATKARGFDRT